MSSIRWRSKGGERRLKKLFGGGHKTGFEGRLRLYIGPATERIAMHAVSEMRKVIQAGVRPKNRPLTTIIKGSNKPLVDNGDLFQSITYEMSGQFEAAVGVLRADPRFNIAEIIHNGGTINVTDAMRGMFYALWLASIGKLDPSKLEGRAAELFARRSTGWKPIAPSTSAILIPERRFVDATFKKRALKKFARETWKQAIEQAIESAQR